MGAGASNRGTSKSILDIIVLVLLLAAAVRKDETPTPSAPLNGWAGLKRSNRRTRSGSVSCSWVFPSDILTSVAVGGSASAHQVSWWAVMSFVLTPLLLVAVFIALAVSNLVSS
ncbi:hypothetical protein [Arthrobacter sp. TE12232]